MVALTKADARAILIRAQRLDEFEPFGAGVRATTAAIEHLGYVQIDTINVIERSHHHILFNRIPRYRRTDLQAAQTREKTVFEYWTHALSYVPTRDFKYFLGEMNRVQKTPSAWFQSVTKSEFQKVLKLIETSGPISIRDIQDDELVEKDHPWASRKPSKRVLQLGFHSGRLVISERLGMLKKYELTARHFGWNETRSKPNSASEKEVTNYRIDRALRSQGLVTLDSICHLAAKKKPLVLAELEKRTKAGNLVEVRVRGVEKVRQWTTPACASKPTELSSELTHLLSPFDPLVIQRKRLLALFDYEHRFEAYLPPEKRVMGYFALPVLVGDRVVAAIDIKTDRAAKRLKIQKWSWMGRHRSAANRRLIEDELDRFERFQLGV